MTGDAKPEVPEAQNVTGARLAEQDRNGLEERIARRAYERYEARGREPGLDQDDWFQAERELLGEDTPGSRDVPRMA
jgi:DnaJ-domain-containing protein 1